MGNTQLLASFWDPTELDLFQFWRWLLAVICTIYALLITGHWLAGWLLYLSKPDRMRAVLRNYIVVQILRLRALRFWWELVQIAFWLAAFVVVVRMHHWIAA